MRIFRALNGPIKYNIFLVGHFIRVWKDGKIDHLYGEYSPSKDNPNFVELDEQAVNLVTMEYL